MPAQQNIVVSCPGPVWAGGGPGGTNIPVLVDNSSWGESGS